MRSGKIITQLIGYKAFITRLATYPPLLTRRSMQDARGSDETIATAIVEELHVADCLLQPVSRGATLKLQVFDLRNKPVGIAPNVG